MTVRPKAGRCLNTINLYFFYTFDLYLFFLTASVLEQEWEDNKQSLLEFAWQAHLGFKVRSLHINQTIV